MKNGLMVYHTQMKDFNVGDYIQSLAAKQYFANIDVCINREKLNEYDGDEVKLIMNGWFTHNLSGNWTPSPRIRPLFVSFHLNTYAETYILNDESVYYLKRHEPIGCRDYSTVRRLNARGIEAYFTGCLTLTLDLYKRPSTERTDNIYIVDPLYGYFTKEKVFATFKSTIYHTLKGNIFKIHKRKRHLKKILHKDILNKGIWLNQQLPVENFNDEDRFKIAEEMLDKYAKAKIVITSRIHCALPCLALGTPVIYINAFNNESDAVRLDGLAELFNRVDIYDTKKGLWKANFELNGDKVNEKSIVKPLETHIKLQRALKDKCKEFAQMIF